MNLLIAIASDIPGKAIIICESTREEVTTMDWDMPSRDFTDHELRLLRRELFAGEEEGFP